MFNYCTPIYFYMVIQLTSLYEYYNNNYNAWTAKRSLNPLPLQPNEPVAY